MTSPARVTHIGIVDREKDTHNTNQEGSKMRNNHEREILKSQLLKKAKELRAKVLYMSGDKKSEEYKAISKIVKRAHSALYERALLEIHEAIRDFENLHTNQGRNKMLRDRTEYEADIRATVGNDAMLRIGRAYHDEYGDLNMRDDEIVPFMNGVRCDADWGSSNSANWQFYFYLPGEMVAVVWFESESGGWEDDYNVEFYIASAEFVDRHLAEI